MTALTSRLGRLPFGRLVALFMCATLIPLAALAVISVTLASSAVKGQAEARVRDTAVVSASLVAEQINGLTNVVQSYAGRPALVSAMAPPDAAAPDAATITRQLLSLHSANAGNLVTFVSDPAGRLIDAVPATPSIIGMDFSYRDWYRGVMASGRPYVSEAYQSLITGHPRVVGVAAPVLDGQHRVVAILVAGYDVESIQSFVTRFAEVQGLGLTTTDQRGTLISAPGQLPPGLVSQKTDPSVAAALQGQSGVVDKHDPGGDTLEGYAPVPGLGWTVRTEVPASAALASVSSLWTRVLAIATGVGFLIFAILGLLVIVMRRRAQSDAALAVKRREAAESDALFTLSLDLFAVAGFDGYFKRLNRAWTDTLGYSLDELQTHPFLEFVHPDDVERTVQETAELAAGEVTVAFENRYRHADGSYRTLAWSARARPDDGLIYAVARDVTAQKHAVDELRLAEARAVEVARLKSEFLANMSHEIRTPMNGVIGMTDLLLATGLTAQQAEYAEIIRRSGDALLAVISDILDFSKIESGRLELDLVDVHVRTLVEDVAEIVAAAAHSATLEVTTVIDPSLPDWVLGDASRLRQILLNLTGNAVKFTEHGDVVIRASSDGDADGITRVRFEVTDTGIGMSPDTQSKLFTAFTQADASTTRKYGGTGLGLAISSQLVSLMGGDIGVQSELGKGSTFWFVLPLRTSSNSELARWTQSAQATHLLDGLRVLVVDDNSTNQTILRESLASWGALPQVASGGAEALRMLQDAAEKKPFSLVILDYMMPEMNGLEVARCIRSDPRLGHPRLILLTSAAFHTAADTRAAGIDATVSKPVRRSLLYDALVTVIAGSDGRAARPSPPVTKVTSHRLGSRLLVAEDNAVNQLVAARMLESLGYQVDVVANGFEAVEAVMGQRYAGVLMDCQMPVMDGFQATAEIRRRETGGAHVPIVAMTAGAMEGDAERCLAAGMDGYLTKPMKSADLAPLLAAWTSPQSTAPTGPLTPTVPAGARPGAMGDVPCAEIGAELGGP